MKQRLLDWLRPQPAADDEPATPATRIPALPGPWQHPQATHSIVLGQQALTYRLQRSRRRSIGLRIGPEGLDVRAPSWSPLAEIESALQHKSAWVIAKLQEAHERQQQAENQRLDWREGGVLPYLGGGLDLRISPPQAAAPRGGWLDESNPGQPVLWLTLPPAAHTPACTAQERQQLLEAAARAWLHAQARRVFTARLDHFAPQVGVRWQRLTVSSARTRWGSASADGSIRLNRQLLHLPLTLVDYVVVHELAHLHEMNHSPRFWAHVERVLPDWAQRRQALRAQVLAAA